MQGATVDELANRLPKTELGRLIQRALQNAEKGTSFTEVDLLGTTPPQTLVQHVPLAHLWETVVVPKIADRHGYAGSYKAPAAEMPKPAMPDLPPPPVAPVAKEAAPAKVATPMPKDKDVVPTKEAAKVKSKVADIPAKPAAAAEPPALQADYGPSVHKSPLMPFGDDSDDIEVTEDDVQAV